VSARGGADAWFMTHAYPAFRTHALARFGAIVALSTAVACASTPTPVRLAGHPEALSALTGNWSGRYAGVESRRSGVISFSLRAGDTTAFGDVLMIPNGYEQHNVWTEREHHAKVAPQHPQVLTITFVGIASQRVSGMLDPYTDPDCDCLVLTTFVGRLTSASTLEGTYITRIPGTPRVQTGTWKAERERR
jgi:hypothetical protein